MRKRTLGIVAGLAFGAAAVGVWRRRANRSPLPVAAWRPVLAGSYGPHRAENLLALAETRYRALAAAHPRDAEPALRKHALESILPGLALYQVLLDVHCGDKDAALAAIEPAFEAWAGTLNQVETRLLRLFPRPFALVRLVFRFRMRRFPQAGWEFMQIENSPTRIAFDAHSCFYLKTLTSYGAPELTASFCRMDDWQAETFPPGITFTRTRTLGRGDDCCDFRYELAASPAWTMPSPDLDLLACPACLGRLAAEGETGAEILRCSECGRSYPVVRGIPRFVDQSALSGYNRRFAYLYDWFSWIYRWFSRAAFAFIGMSEEAGRREVLDRLEPCGGRVLEVSIGPGVNLPYLVARDDVGEVHGLDISQGQLNRCQSYLRRKGWHVPLYLGNAEELPFQGGTFDSVFHIGGINFFDDKAKALAEMVRVAKPGAHILVCDETERGAQAYERTLPGFSNSFKQGRAAVSPPLDALPPGMEEVRLFDVWKGWMYCLEFRTPREVS